jgi:hypothetical protein
MGALSTEVEVDGRVSRPPNMDAAVTHPVTLRFGLLVCVCIGYGAQIVCCSLIALKHFFHAAQVPLKVAGAGFELGFARIVIIQAALWAPICTSERDDNLVILRREDVIMFCKFCVFFRLGNVI